MTTAQSTLESKIQSNMIISTKELADLTKLNKRFWETKRSHGDGPPYIRLDRSVRYFWQDVEDWLNQKKENIK